MYGSPPSRGRRRVVGRCHVSLSLWPDCLSRVAVLMAPMCLDGPNVREPQELREPWMRTSSKTRWLPLGMVVALMLAALSGCQREDASRIAASSNPNVLKEPQTGLDFP